VRGQIQEAQLHLTWIKTFTPGEKAGHFIHGIARLVDCVETLAEDCDPAYLGAVLDAVSAANQELLAVRRCLSEPSWLRNARDKAAAQEDK
jgi:hypothetical protein